MMAQAHNKELFAPTDTSSTDLFKQRLQNILDVSRQVSTVRDREQRKNMLQMFSTSSREQSARTQVRMQAATASAGTSINLDSEVSQIDDNPTMNANRTTTTAHDNSVQDKSSTMSSTSKLKARGHSLAAAKDS